ncbi:hypothetical protein VSX61_06550 [Brenneria populi subsp. brevivirga]|uniref:Uncharacterized protein n=1 Tax=Brenneria populi TaxID=1505588 RepID=A0ABU6JMD0_9GAMM|nr:hypothetical protein [Brenneria populi subsp. brevivirga]MEC5341829.1 hypothetical protein [Brenneria populi Li et al. 2015]
MFITVSEEHIVRLMLRICFACHPLYGSNAARRAGKTDFSAAI